MQQKHYDVIVIGGAVTGSATAYFLTANPDFTGSVLVIEKDATYQKCATTLSAASIRHQFSTRENIQMSQFGTQFLRTFSEQLAVNENRPDAAFHEGGYLFLATSAGHSTLKHNHAIQKALDVDVALLSPEALSDRFPWMNTDDLAAGSLGLSGEGWLDAYGMMQGMRKKAIQQGATYLLAEVATLRFKGDRITGVQLTDGSELSCDTLINAAGTAAPALTRQVGIALPVQSRKRCVFYIECPQKLPDCPMVIDPSGAYFRPEGRGFITGIAPPPELDNETFDFDVEHQLFEDVLWPILAQRVPAFEALRCVHSWAGHYDMNTIDQNVIIGPHPDMSNLLFANGFSGHGMQQAPAAGRALSELIIYGDYRSLDLSRLGWHRILNNQPIVELNVV